MTRRTAQHDTIRIDRSFDAAPDRVFNAWADAEAHHRWFVTGEGWEVAEYNHDFRVGGREGGRFRRVGDATVYTNDTVYHDIVPGERIVFAYTMARDGERFSVSLATVELRPDGRGTALTFTEQIAVLDGGDTSEMRKKGWGWLLDALEKELRRGRA